jgi:hypothetical protein
MERHGAPLYGGFNIDYARRLHGSGMPIRSTKYFNVYSPPGSVPGKRDHWRNKVRVDVATDVRLGYGPGDCGEARWN